MRPTTRALALVTGTLFAVLAAIDIPHEQAEVFESPADYLLEATFTLALLAAAVTLWTLARAARGARLAGSRRLGAGGRGVEPAGGGHGDDDRTRP